MQQRLFRNISKFRRVLIAQSVRPRFASRRKLLAGLLLVRSICSRASAGVPILFGSQVVTAHER
jgi:hypothetical protein